MQTAYISHPDCLKHDMGPHHPECPQRLTAIEDQLMVADLLPYLQQHDAPLASLEQLGRVHEEAYLESIFKAAPAQGVIELDADTLMNVFTLPAALRAAGAAVQASELVMGGKVANAFCAVRPPGHHAEPGRAMGFCLFNNVAVGVAHVLEQFDLQRVAIVDFDVHHGNGTEAIFRDDERVMLCSSFQHPFYPFCGTGDHPPHIVDVPLPAGTKGAGFRDAIIEFWLPALHAFKPEMVFISAGFDGHRDDEMANFDLLESDYSWVTAQMMAIAQQYSAGRIVSMLEGGYDLHALGRSVSAHVKVLSGL